MTTFPEVMALVAIVAVGNAAGLILREAFSQWLSRRQWREFQAEAGKQAEAFMAAVESRKNERVWPPTKGAN